MPANPSVSPAKLVRAVEWLRHHLYRLQLRLALAPIAMVELILAGWVSQAIQAAAELRVADLACPKPAQRHQVRIAEPIAEFAGRDEGRVRAGRTAPSIA